MHFLAYLVLVRTSTLRSNKYSYSTDTGYNPIFINITIPAICVVGNDYYFIAFIMYDATYNGQYVNIHLNVIHVNYLEFRILK